MATEKFIQTEFAYGYSSGRILSDATDPVRLKEEEQIGGRYFDVFTTLVAPRLNAGTKVLELGPGRGSWTLAMLETEPECEVHTVDFQDIGQWVDISGFNGRLTHHLVNEGHSFAGVPRGYFDFFFAWGVLCHWRKEDVAAILQTARSCMKPGATAVVQYAAWEKLDQYGWERGGVPVSYKTEEDQDIWWPRNTVTEMESLCRKAGWIVEKADCGIVQRDGVAILRVTG